MKTISIGLMFLLTIVAAQPADAQGARGPNEGGYMWGFGVGPSWAMSGDFVYSLNDFKNTFDTGLSAHMFFAGPAHELIGWRAEIGYDGMPGDADGWPSGASSSYNLLRVQGGVQIMPWYDRSKGRPYGFFTVGFVREDVDLDNVPLPVVIEPATNFGMNFGGGYTYQIGSNWGIAGDVHFNIGFFDDATRMWWSPSGVLYWTW